MNEVYNEPACEIGGEGRNVCAIVQSIRNEAFRSGSIAALAMIPFGVVFTWLNLDVNEYGIAIIQRYFGNETMPVRFFLFLGLHFLVSWLAAAPLLLLLLRTHHSPAWVTGLLYGASFWLIVNSFLLPTLFDRPIPWQNGLADILPSLVVHLVYGLSVALTSRGFVARQNP